MLYLIIIQKSNGYKITKMIKNKNPTILMIEIKNLPTSIIQIKNNIISIINII